MKCKKLFFDIEKVQNFHPLHIFSSIGALEMAMLDGRTSVSNGYLAQSMEGRFTELTSYNMQLNRIFLTETLESFSVTKYLVLIYSLE